MRLKAEQLEGHLARKLAPVYAIYGDEPLLVLSASTVALTEGGTGTFTVRLAVAPAGPVSVSTRPGAILVHARWVSGFGRRPMADSSIS